MAFKSVKEYNEERFGNMFLLRNDGDYADVIFLYRSVDEVLVADAHYLISASYRGYAHCCGTGCPACAKGIRVQTRLFIPVYNIQAQEIQFFDRSLRFENQLNHDVFNRFPNPSEYVFRITRHGAANDINTTYNITAVGKNTLKSYNEIMSEFNITFPDYFNTICKDIPAPEMSNMLNNSSPSNDTAYTGSDMQAYQVTPRSVTGTATPEPEIPESLNEPEGLDLPDAPVAEDLDEDDVDF